MASLQRNCTSSFKHHLTGEAWPASTAILPFHSNTTTRQARHACGAPKPRFASGTVCKNRHLRSAEKHPGGRLCMRPARLCPGDAPGAVEPHGMEVMHGLAIDRSFFSYRPSAGAAPRSVPTQQKCSLRFCTCMRMHPKR